MKRFFGFARKKEPAAVGSGPGASSSSSSAGAAAAVGGGYELRSKDLGKLHRAAANGDLEKLQQLAKKHDLNQLDKANRFAGRDGGARGGPVPTSRGLFFAS